MRCCSIIQDLITGVVPGVVDSDPIPQFLTYALVPDPDLSGFLDWQFVGYESLDMCNFPNFAFNTNFGVTSSGCFDGAYNVFYYWENWAVSNGTPYPAQADQGRDQTALAAYIFIFWGQNTPPDMQITTALGAPVVPNWQVIVVNIVDIYEYVFKN